MAGEATVSHRRQNQAGARARSQLQKEEDTKEEETQEKESLRQRFTGHKDHYLTFLGELVTAS